jgi:hypothetical protein
LFVFFVVVENSAEAKCSSQRVWGGGKQAKQEAAEQQHTKGTPVALLDRYKKGGTNLAIFKGRSSARPGTASRSKGKAKGSVGKTCHIGSAVKAAGSYG